MGQESLLGRTRRHPPLGGLIVPLSVSDDLFYSSRDYCGRSGEGVVSHKKMIAWHIKEYKSTEAMTPQGHFTHLRLQNLPLRNSTTCKWTKLMM